MRSVSGPTSTADSAATASTSVRPRIDGRRLRSTRTRQAIIEAYIALLRENPRVPTAARIAERAGYSIRSVFERFPDLHALRVAATDHILAQSTAQGMAGNVEGDRQTRLRAYVETRGRNCEHWLPLWRALNANQGDSAELKARIHRVHELTLMRIELIYRPELSTLEELDRRQTLIAMQTLVDFESWAHMREHNGLSVAEACAVWTRAIDRLLPSTPVS